MTLTTTRTPAITGYTGPTSTPPLPVRDAAIHVARTFEQAPIYYGVPAACRAAALNACTAVESHLATTLMQVAHTEDSAEVAMRVNDVGDAYAALIRHEATTGHDECCGDNCECAPGPRCPTCQTAPHEMLDNRVALLLEVPARRLSNRVHDQLYVAAAAA